MPDRLGRRARLVSAAFALLVLVSCGGSGDPDTDVLQTVVLREWAVTKSLPTAPAGDVRFRVRNNGSLGHNLVVIRTDLGTGDLPVDASTASVDVQAAGELIGEVASIGGSQESSVTYNLSVGRYVLICNIPGHYQQGMATDMTVE